ncbi:LysM peptidoglycan-binding domain-containing protein [bacterium]|nr:LysM peptidoglycan-binding domain-containing protein [bacterium]
MPDQGKLEKLIIKGYKDPKFKTPVSGDRGSFKLQVNPTDYTLKMSAPPKETTSETLANGQTIDKIMLAEKRNISLKFHLDSTGVVPGITSVPTAIDDLKWLCVEFQGEVHDSFFLQIVWNSLVFNCKCESLGINYLLFKPNGEPLRAVVTANFKEFIDAKTKALKNNTSSPDMTHLRTMKSGDSLPALCEEIYGSPKYYLQVAKANGIINFRNIQPGKQVLFPRLEK